MKIYKKIFTAIIVAITILGLVAFYAPIRNIRPKVSSPTVSKDLSASLNNPASQTPTSTAIASSSKPASSIPSFDDMSGFSGLNQENDLFKGKEASSSGDEIEKNFKELNQ